MKSALYSALDNTFANAILIPGLKNTRNITSTGNPNNYVYIELD